MKRKLLSLLALALCWASSTWADYSGSGTGTSADPYQITSAAQLMEFAGIVNGGATTACAVLTGSITLTDDMWTNPIGISSYKGHFNGQGNTIYNLTYTTNQNNHGLFGKLAAGAVVENFTIYGTITNSDYDAIAVIGYTSGTSVNIRNIHSYLNITNSGNDKKIGGIVGNGNQGTTNIDRCTFSGSLSTTDKANVGGIAGYIQNNGSTYVNFTNCLFDKTGTVTSTSNSAYCGGIIGYIGAGNSVYTIKNCLALGTVTATYAGSIFGYVRNAGGGFSNNYYSGTKTSGRTEGGGADNNATSVTEEALATGEICYGLNGSTNGGTNWYQTIGTDNYPIPFSTSQRVYKKSASAYASFDVADEKIQISGAADLTDFAGVVNTGGYSLNAVLTADIDMDGAGISNFPIGTGASDGGKRYTGTFDGQGHKISNFELSSSSSANYGMFNTGDGVTLKNFWLDSSCSIEGTTEVGLIGRHDGGGTFEGLGSYAPITGSTNHVGGLIGAAWGRIKSGATKKDIIIKNCWTAGKVTSDSNGGAICGWFNHASKVKFENCWTIAEVTHPSSENNYIFSKGAESDSPLEVNDYCYSMHGSQSGFKKINNNGQLTSGELCYLLNGSTSGGTNWYQTLETDAFPYPYSTGHSMVYAEHQHCDGSAYDPTVFANMQNKDAHNKVSGFCTYCGEPDTEYAGYITPNGEGIYEIDSEAKLNWFASFVNAGTTGANASSNAKLTANISLANPLTTPIGNGTNIYKGIFDGCGFTISNFTTTPCKHNGLFGYIENAKIKDFTISGSIETLSSSKGNYIGVIGQADGTEVEVSGIHSALHITVKNDASAGGIIGGSGTDANAHTPTIEKCSYSGTLEIAEGATCNSNGGIIGYTAAATIKDCLFSGTVTGSVSGKAFGGIVGYTKQYIGGIQNCLSVGTVSGTDGYHGAIIGQYNSTTDRKNRVYNNFYKDGPGVGLNESSVITTAKTTEELQSGEVAYLLNGDQSTINWYQTLGTGGDTYPTLDSSSEQVLYVGDAGYTTFYDTTGGWELLGDAKAYIGTINGSALHLDEIDDIPAGTAVVIGGTYYNKVNATATATTTGNVLLGSDGTKTGGEGIYALAIKNEKVGFYPVASTVTIPAGKAYLDLNGPSTVKGFTFVFDDADGINSPLLTSPEEEGQVYNLSGQMVNGKLPKGIYIVNGKKILF